jgi:hypothetical protein
MRTQGRGTFAVGHHRPQNTEHRTLYSFNVRVYYRLHGEFLANGKSHAKIVLAQQRYSVGEQMRRLLKLIEIKSGEEMVNQIEFLSDWE